jgi:23S rRNA G2069 N7-methylase RlmK/C1962 C5-methylase RlmI
LDQAALAEQVLKATDITGRTIPKDFERTPGVHRCWEIRLS